MSNRHNLNRSSLTVTAFMLILMLFFVNYPIPFLYGIELYLFTAIAWFVYFRYSLNYALLLIIFAAACGIFIWNQSPLLALYPLEILFVGWIARRSKRSTVLWDAIYWLTLGLLLFYPAYRWLTDWSDSNGMTYFLFSVANGLINIFFGKLAAEYLPVGASKKRKKWRIGQITFHLCMVLLIVPTLIYLLVSGYFTYQRSLSEISSRLDTIYSHVNERLNHLTETELRDLKVRSMVQKASLQHMFSNITTGTDVQITLIDDNHNVVTTLEPAIADNFAYEWSAGGIVKQVTDSLYLWQPEEIPSYNKVYRWAKSEFVSVYHFDRVPYTLVVKQPAIGFQHNMFNLYVISVLLVGMSTLIAAFVAYRVMNQLSRSITQLGSFTTGLPRRIRLRETITWEESPLHEVNILKNNFEDMSKELASMFCEVNKREDKLRVMAHYDTLTGLGNRYSFGLYLPSLIEEAKKDHTKIACLFIDLDRFKSINDNYGHEAGDAVIKEVGARLKEYNTAQTKAFRLSGDEFVVVLREPFPRDLVQWAQDIQASLINDVIMYHDQRIQIELSAGISIYPDHGQDAQILLRSSDHAMYQAKVSGRNRVKLSTGATMNFPKGGA